MYTEMLAHGVTSVFVMLAHTPTFPFLEKPLKCNSGLKLANKPEPVSNGDRTSQR